MNFAPLIARGCETSQTTAVMPARRRAPGRGGSFLTRRFRNLARNTTVGAGPILGRSVFSRESTAFRNGTQFAVTAGMSNTGGQAMDMPSSPETAADALRAANERAERATRRAEALEHLVEAGIAVMSEPTLPALLERILLEARRVTKAQAGTLFLLEGDELQFAIAQND